MTTTNKLKGMPIHMKTVRTIIVIFPVELKRDQF